MAEKEGSVLVLLGNGDGTFGDVNEFYAGPHIEALRTCDVTCETGTWEEIIVSSAVPGLIMLKPADAPDAR